MLDREATIVMNMIPGIGHVRYTALKEAFGSPAGVSGRSAEELARVPGIGSQLAEKTAAYDWEGGLQAELELCDRAGVRIITLWDEAYPEVLRTLYDPPLCLYVRGKLPPFPDNAVAMVGTRRMTQYGARMTRMITEEAVAAGYTIVSGLAFGVDTVAHTATVEMGGITVAVLGGGLMRVHPQENVPLARRIVETGGALVSEFPMMCPVSRTTFPRRNRIVAGMSRATIVTEAGVGSGALITAKLALDNGREVFAVPGHADNMQAKGCHRLIKEGAGLIESFSDVLDSFGVRLGGYLPGFEPDCVGEGAVAYDPGSSSDLSADERRLLALLGEGERALEELSGLTSFDTGRLLGVLMSLEMKMLVEHGADQVYRLI
ncbi:MAG: DNA-protecting protein DprA [Lentisphaeria bacterium]|nr:DNA-protecting protein DprA [Lentisphaeria bacterium]